MKLAELFREDESQNWGDIKPHVMVGIERMVRKWFQQSDRFPIRYCHADHDSDNPMGIVVRFDIWESNDPNQRAIKRTVLTDLREEFESLDDVDVELKRRYEVAN